jgi:hypothetical protein
MPSNESSVSGADETSGEQLARSVAGNIIERSSIAPHRAAEDGELDEHRRRRIAMAAYYRAERRGFAPGGELEDWLEAERELLEQEGGGAVG